MNKTIRKYNLWGALLIKNVILLAQILYMRFIRIAKDKSGALNVELFISNTTYTAKGIFKEKSAITMTDKLVRLMQNELEKENNPCYNHYNTNSKCGRRRRILRSKITEKFGL